MKYRYIFTLIIAVFLTSAFAQDNAGSILTLPQHYDRGVTRRVFSLDADSLSLSDRVTMDSYLHSPQSVAPATESQQEEPSLPSAESLTKTELPVVREVPRTIDEPLEEVNLYVSKPHFWTFSGDYSLQFMQNYISPNWYKSGNSTYSMLGAVVLQYNYNNKQRVKWDNKLELKLGFQSTDADTVNNFKTNEDLIRYTTQFSLRAHKRWYYAAQFIANTQFTKGLKNNDKTVYSDFMSPFNLNISLGMNYVVEALQKKLTGNILFAPFSYRLTYIDRADLETRFGVDEGKHTRNDFGSLINAEVTWKPFDNFKWQTRFYIYTTYKNTLLEWENTLTFQFNRYISANLFIYPRFDDSVSKTTSTLWQLKEYLSVGFAYSM